MPAGLTGGLTGPPKRTRGRPVLSVVRVLAAAAVLLALLWKNPAGFKSYCYGAIREIIRAYAVHGNWNMARLSSDNFIIRFNPEDRPVAELVLETAELFFVPVTRDFNYQPRARIPIILYSCREELNRTFGWEASESAMGVYWAGTIRVLSPHAWILETEPEKIREVFTCAGPMAHELTHLVVDYLTWGNYPRWFTEGLAQYQEYKLTGFEMTLPLGRSGGPLYAYDELSADFDNLADQTMAYRSALLGVRGMVDRHGEEVIQAMLAELGRGKSFCRALGTVTGMTEEEFARAWPMHE